MFTPVARVLVGALIFSLLSPSWTSAETNSEPILQLEKHPRPAHEPILEASDAAERALRNFTLPDGFQAHIFAAEPMLANPVAFCLDAQGRVFVSETHRFNTSVLDIRRYMEMLDADLASQTVEQRVAMTKKFFGDAANDLAIETEIVRLLEDRDGDGRADASSVYADGFNTQLDGIASGVLAHRGKVLFANIPAIWELTGINDKGGAVTRKVLSYGYGVRFSYTGHDLHGLIIGPDGRLYFSFGDRGATVKTKEGKTLEYPDEGAVFRCNLDGSELEVVHRGLRNPQELAFDEFGNLFTGDNDFDHGDRERWVNIVDGADSGWRVGYQHPPLGYDAVPWMLENLWQPAFEGQAAYLLPPVANVEDGPSGLVYYPGTGLPPEYDGQFFLCHFKGAVTRSGIKTVTVRPKGAGFELTEAKPFLWNVEATDVDFGPDSQMYVADWGEGWERNRKGRVFRVAATNHANTEIVRETKRLFAQGFEQTSQADLLKLLTHPNMRVRMEAQFTLAERGKRSVDALAKVAASAKAEPRARRHAIWALGQIGRTNKSTLAGLTSLLRDPDQEVRAQTARVLGDGRHAGSQTALIKLLEDPNDRVKFHAAQALGRIGHRDAFQPLVALLRQNNNRDLYLRVAAMVALSRVAEAEQIAGLAQDESSAVRVGAIVALRRLESPQVARFLNDADPLLVLEAARAINDVPIEPAMPQLAELAKQRPEFPQKYSAQNEALQLRAVNATARLGGAERAQALAEFAVRKDSVASAAAESMHALGSWSEPGTRDRVVGVHRPYDSGRDGATAAEALVGVIDEVLDASRPEPVQLAAIEAAQRLSLEPAVPALRKLFSDKKGSEEVRLSAFLALETLAGEQLAEIAKQGQADDSELVRKEANRLATRLNPENAIPQIKEVLATGSIPEKQGAIMTLGGLKSPEATAILDGLLDQLIADDLNHAVRLELVEALAKNSDQGLAEKFMAFQKKVTEPIEPYLTALEGGNAEAGRKIFYERAEAACVRCHKVNNEGGDVGPPLTPLAKHHTRRYLLEGIVLPNAEIAAGFETVLVTTKNGQSFAGVFKSEDDNELVLNSPEDGIVNIKKADITDRQRGSSGMPEGLGEILSKRDLRDLVEFLATAKPAGDKAH